MAAVITKLQLDAARDAAIDALENSRKFVSKWQMRVFDRRNHWKSEDWQNDFDSIERMQVALCDALSPEILVEIELNAAASLPPVAIFTYQSATAHESATAALDLAIVFGKVLRLNEDTRTWREEVKDTASFFLWTSELNDSLIARIKKEWALSAGAADKKRDSGKENGKKLPPNDVNDAARYIREQKKLIRAGKRLEAGKKELIAEHVVGDQQKINRLSKELQPSRFGWLLDI